MTTGVDESLSAVAARDLATRGPLRKLWTWVHDGPLVHSYYALGLSAVVLVAMGAMMVLSSSSVESISADQSAFFFFQRQLVFGIGGLLLMVALSFIPPLWYRRLAITVFWASMLVLIAVIPYGTSVNGNQNWLVIAGFSLQPSEAAKLACAMALGVKLGEEARQPLDWKSSLWPSALYVCVPVGLVVFGRDVGTALVFVLIYAAALFFAGAPLRLFGLAGIVVAVMGALSVVTAPHRMQRIVTWITGDCTVGGTCWQAHQGMNALATGGWWGVGLGQSRSKYSYVPEAHNDYIFSIIGEELGLIGTLLILSLFAVMAVAMARVLLRSHSGFERITTGCILAWLIGQAFINIGMVTGALPVIGIPLPFISYGGSSLLMCLCAVGVVMSFTRLPRAAAVARGAQSYPKQEVR